MKEDRTIKDRYTIIVLLTDTNLKLKIKTKQTMLRDHEIRFCSSTFTAFYKTTTIWTKRPSTSVKFWPLCPGWHVITPCSLMAYYYNIWARCRTFSSIFFFFSLDSIGFLFEFVLSFFFDFYQFDWIHDIYHTLGYRWSFNVAPPWTLPFIFKLPC